MKKENKKVFLGVAALFAGALLLSGCTANFCSDIDKAHIAYPYEQGVTVYVDSLDEVPTEYRAYPELCFQPIAGSDVYAYVPIDQSTGNFSAKKATYLVDTIISGAKTNSYSIPSQQFFIEIDKKVLNAAVEASGITDYSSITADIINPFSSPDCVGNEEGVTENADSLLRKYGYLKFYGDEGLWSNYETWLVELQDDAALGAESCPSPDFWEYYKNQINSTNSAIRSCLTISDGSFGHYGASSNWGVELTAKSYKDAWKKGFLEGLIVWPVAALEQVLATAIDPALSGVGQLVALLIVTLIARLVVISLTFKSTLDQQKMQSLQPQIAKIQAKYPNSNTNKAEQARLSQETMALYKRNKVSPFSSLLVMIIQFPIFIAVWGALQSSAVLSSGNVLNLSLSDTIRTVLFNFKGTWYLNTTGWWTALVLYLLMAVSQFLAMKLPQWMNKKRLAKMGGKMSANPAQDKSARTMKWVSWGMLIFTCIIGFSLPAAMGVYWAIGGFISMAQTLIMQTIMAKKQQSKGR